MKYQVKDLMALAGSEAFLEISSEHCWHPTDPLRAHYDPKRNTVYLEIWMEDLLAPGGGHGSHLRGESSGASLAVPMEVDGEPI
jgi:hypothetical protein